MANAPGPLELLPTAQYKTKSGQGTRHWLRASYTTMNSEGQAQEQDVLLGDGDPYADIYLNNSEDWWKLVKEDLIDPAGRAEREKAKSEGKEIVEENEGITDFSKFVKNMERARELHNLINDKYHKNTYAYYAADPKQLAWNEVHWKSDKSLGGDLKAALLSDDDFNGMVTLSFEEKSNSLPPSQMDRSQNADKMPNVTAPVLASNTVEINGHLSRSPKKQSKYRFQIQKAQGPGDGTVPEESGAAPTPHVVQIFRHEGKGKGHESYDHQNSYNAKIAQASTLYSIVKIVAESDWLQQNLSKT
jgi:hypothetical protein